VGAAPAAVLWDMDGTLVDTEPYWMECEYELVAEHGGRWSTEEEVAYVVEKLTTVVRRLREMSPLYEMVKEGVDLSKMQWVTH